MNVSSDAGVSSEEQINKDGNSSKNHGVSEEILIDDVLVGGGSRTRERSLSSDDDIEGQPAKKARHSATP